MALVQAATIGPADVALKDASAALKGKTQCVAFKWVSDDKSTPKAAISIPVKINGKSIPLQLDTGADATILYGAIANHSGWTERNQETFRADTFMIGSTNIDRPLIHVDASMDEDVRLVGTIGLSELMGRIAVIDYPLQRFCLFAEADLPTELANAPYVRADLRNAKFFVPIDVGAFHSDAIVFDTGSSLMPLNVDLVTWKELTGIADTTDAPATITGSAWGKPVTFSGAPAAEAMMLGTLNLKRPTVFTNKDQPTPFADWPFRADGVLGNASLWDGIVIIDLTAKVRFGFVR